jgi:hypothetical protein
MRMLYKSFHRDEGGCFSVSPSYPCPLLDPEQETTERDKEVMAADVEANSTHRTAHITKGVQGEVRGKAVVHSRTRTRQFWAASPRGCDLWVMCMCYGTF